MKYLLIGLSLSIMMDSVKANTVYDESLNARQQCIVTIAAFTANGNLAKLNNAIHEGLEAGLTVSEIKEVIIQMYAYAGFPRSLNALHTMMDILKERKSKGINDPEGKKSSPYPNNKSSLEFGSENQTRLVGSPVKGDVYEFAPAIDQFLKEHLFGDIFGRDILDWQTREVATIAALASLGGTDNQLRSHFKVGMNNGLTKDQLDNIVSIIRTKVGETEGNNAAKILRAVLGLEEGVKKEKSANSNFVGTVSVKMLVNPDSLFNTQMGAVTFEPGARTNWHYHPSGQILIITDGTAYYQEKGKPKQILSKGQIVKCPPNVQHWHGATQHGSMTHLALTPDLKMGGVVWLQKVTDEEYESKK
ncbi:MAG: carboxymuconolactone decarboxylase family protein [Bacteroidetes bacterium]|nr:carboxymuconolactone decarboxylase family protein [Bacteroidota bacterium]MBS1540416.1 carboxymuconolactone decarboxylase family protein [Bacteroidota bacterium]